MKNIDISRFSQLYEVRRLGVGDAETVFALASENKQFYEHSDRACSIEGICSDMELLPPGKEAVHKYYLGFYEYGYLIAVMDFIDGYPDEDTAYIGFFMLDECMQGKKIGTSMIERICLYCEELGYRRVMLGYEKANTQASGFWESMGFESLREIMREHGIIVVAERNLGASRTQRSFAQCLREQSRIHPSMQARDALKICYQAAFGAEHGVSEPAAARKYLRDELKSLPWRCASRFYEQISPELCRVNLQAWKNRELKWQWLYNMFALAKGTGDIAPYLAEVGKLAADGELPFTAEEWETELGAWDGKPVSHSESYREAENPAYRIVPMRFVNSLRVLQAMAEYPDGCIVAIDGNSNSGKTSLAEALAEITGAGVVHMDDFCMPAGRSEVERLGLPGGNIAYDLFKREVLPNLRSGKAFSHLTFDCSRIRVGGKKRVRSSPYRIVEGSFSQHSIFGSYMDVRVFMSVDKAEQRRRVLLRDGDRLAPSYFSVWIPMEDEYFQFFNLKEKSDVVIAT